MHKNFIPLFCFKWSIIDNNKFATMAYFQYDVWRGFERLTDAVEVRVACGQIETVFMCDFVILVALFLLKRDLNHVRIKI